MLRLFLAPLLILLASVAIAESDKHQHGRIGYHGMLLFNVPNTGLFVSHLPLYSKPHDYQIVYQVKFEGIENNSALFDEGMFTILPEKFDLNLLIEQQVFSLNTKIYSGHFERGGKKISTGKIQFSKPILVKPLSKSFSSHHAEFYLTPISEKLALAVHKIQAAPSFDSISIFPLNTDKHADMKLCEQPNNVLHANILSAIRNCGLTPPIYLETQDFR